MLALEPPGIQRVESRAIALTTASPGKIAQGRRAARWDLAAIVRPLSRRLARPRRRWLFGSAIGAAPAPHLGAFAARHHALPVDVGDHVAVAAEQRLGRAHFRARGSFPCARRFAPYFANSSFERSFSGPPAQKVHLSILPRTPNAPLCGYCGAPNGQA